MKIFLKLSLFLVALLSIDATPVNGNGTMTVVPYSSDADIAAFHFKGCIPGTTKITPLKGGATEYSCTREKGRRNGSAKHNFSTNLLVYTSSGNFNVQLGGVGGDFGGTLLGLQYSATIDSDWGTTRSVVYPRKLSPEAVEDLGKVCSRDEAFCFDVYDGVCVFSFAHKDWNRACPILMVIDFSVDA